MTKYTVALSNDETRVIVIDMPLDQLKKLEPARQKQHVVAEFNARGVMTPKVAYVWAEKIAEQLDQFETANVAAAKMF